MTQLNIYGDSQAYRLSVYLKHTYKGKNYCLNTVTAVSGYTISQLKALIKQTRPEIQAGSVNLLFIGTNDFKAARSFQQIKKDFLSLMSTLQKITPEQARWVLTTIPLFPRFEHNHSIQQTILQFNKLISSIKTRHISYIQLPFKTDKIFYFHRRFRGSGRVDLIHLNNAGFDLLVGQLDRVLTLTRGQDATATL